MNKKRILNFIGFLFILFSSPLLFSSSLPPPQFTFENEADLVVEGKVEPSIRCVDRKETEIICGKKTAYLLSLKVKKVKKGNLNTPNEKPIRVFVCAGSLGGEPLEQEEAIYYLKQLKPATTVPFWKLIYSDQVIHAAGALPTCHTFDRR